jgi:formate/nitrite transporter FocA (FNT family)
LIGNVARLWSVVLAANLIGAFIFAWLLAHANVFDGIAQQNFAKIAQESIRPAFATLLIRGIFAGWLIALMVWLLPFAESARVWVIIILAYLVGLAGLPHIIAGNVETFYLVSTGALPLTQCVLGYLIPTLIGNTIGGVALVAVGAHAEFIEATDKAK